MKLNEIEQNMWAEQFLPIIEKECSEAVSIFRSTKKLLYRGIVIGPDHNFENAKQIGKEAWLGSSPVGRKPLSRPKTRQKQQDIIDNWLKKNNFKALRSNSIFTTSLHADADFYGKPFVIFPINGFSFTHFEESADLFFDLVTFIEREIPRNYSTDDADRFLEKNIDKVMDKLKPQQSDFAKALLTTHEIAVHGNFYFFSSNYWLGQIRRALLSPDKKATQRLD